VSDFLSRMAARAVGEPAAARPRVPALFEKPGAAGEATLEVVDEEVVAPRGTAGREEPHPAGTRAPAASPPAWPRPDPEPATAPPAPGATPSAPRPHEIAVPPRAISSAQHHERLPEPLQAGRPERLAVTAADGRNPPLASAAVRVTPAVPAVAAAPEPALSAPAAVARHDEPAVRVHIGRLEVRANLQQPAPKQPRREAPRAEELSLADYLRGKRRTG